MIGLGGLTIIHLLDVLRADGSSYFWGSHEGVFPCGLDGSNRTYKPWLKEPYPEIELSRSMASDAGDLLLQNLSGNTIDRDVAALLKAREFDGAYFVYRHWAIPEDAAYFEMDGYLKDQSRDDEQASFRMNQLFSPAELSAYDGLQTRDCGWRYRSAQCGMRRGTLFVPLTTADIFSASTIGRASLALEPNLYGDEVVAIRGGTGAGQERYILSHTATTFTLKSNWSPSPDGTSTFLVTGPGAMKCTWMSPDIFSSNTIGKTGLGRTADQDINELVMITSGTGAGQERLITTNTTTTYTVSPAWTVIPDGSSQFIVVYRSCPKTRDSCSDRGVIERFNGIIQLQPQIVQATVPQSAAFVSQPESSGLGDSW